MLNHLNTAGVGPAHQLELDFADRLNLITGDNGLGKTFILDACWFVLTACWARGMLVPQRIAGVRASIQAELTVVPEGIRDGFVSLFDRPNDTWATISPREWWEGVVLYAESDGGFAVWDAARNAQSYPATLPSYRFGPAQVWSGLSDAQGNRLCEGLLRDWASWQREGGERFALLQRALTALSPSEDHPLRPGRLTRVSITDPFEHPTLEMPYGQQVPLIHASAGMRRIVALAYLLVWTWTEHRAVAALRGVEPEREVVFLIDEIETHLHPQWQRRIVPALLDVVEAMTGTDEVRVQVIATTHAPLVLASMETRFDTARDKVFELDLRAGEVVLSAFEWSRQGDANGWLTSSVFDLKQPRSLEAERAIEAAQALTRQQDPSPEALASAHHALLRALDGRDPFFVRWNAFYQQHGGGPIFANDAPETP